MAPVCDLVLVPLGLSGKEVVVGHIRVATAWLPHGLDGVLVQVTCLGQPKELLHLLEGVLQHEEIATLLGTAIESIQVLLKETGGLKVRNHIGMAKYTAPTTPQIPPTWDRMELRSSRTLSEVLGSQISSVTHQLGGASINGIATTFYFP